MKSAKRRFLILSGFAVAAVTGIAVILSNPHTKYVELGEGRSITFKPPSFLASIGDSKCRIIYQAKGGNLGQTELLYTLMESPIIVVPSKTNANVIFCLYDFDVDFKLLRINLAKPFSPSSPPSALSFIVLKSSWSVEDGNTSDWQTVLEYLQEMQPVEFEHKSVPARDFGFFRQYFSRDDILQRMQHQLKFMEDSESGLVPRRLR